MLYSNYIHTYTYTNTNTNAKLTYELFFRSLSLYIYIYIHTYTLFVCCCFYTTLCYAMLYHAASGSPSWDLHLGHTCHILPPSEIDLGCVWLCLQAQEGNIYFTELAERVEHSLLLIIITLLLLLLLPPPPPSPPPPPPPLLLLLLLLLLILLRISDLPMKSEPPTPTRTPDNLLRKM